MYTIYHNPRCKKSRAGLEYLRLKNAELEIVEYLKEPISVKNFKEILQKLNKTPEEMLRKQETIYKSDFKGKDFSNDEWVQIMVDHPKLIQRPIIVKGNHAVLGDPVENIDQII